MKKDLLFVNSRDSLQKYEEFDTLGFNQAKNIFLKTFDILKPPITLGLYGQWGTGKTEMIKALSEELDKQHFITLIFDAWKYRNDNNLIFPIMCSLENEHLKGRVIQKTSAKKIIGSAAYVMLNHALKHKVGINLGEIKDSLAVMEGEYKNYHAYCNIVSKIETEFHSFIKEIAKSKTAVIFIDNLDRCLPDIVVNLIEDISTFFHSAKCVFVLSMDEKIVIKAIENKYSDFKGRDYLEKIVQLSLKMPTPAMVDAKDGLYHFMKRYEMSKAKYYDANGKLKRSKQGDDRDNIHKAMEIVKEIFNEGIIAIPRRIEQIVNNFVLLENIGAMKFRNDNAVPVLLMLIVKIYLKEVFVLLKDQESWNDFLNLIGMSMQDNTIPSKVDTFKNYHLKSHSLYYLYKNNDDFWRILKIFWKCKNRSPNDFTEQIQKAKEMVEIIG